MKKKSLNLKLLKPYMKGNAGLLALSLVFALLSVSSKAKNKPLHERCTHCIGR